MVERVWRKSQEHLVSAMEFDVNRLRIDRLITAGTSKGIVLVKAVGGSVSGGQGGGTWW
jgi:hypothetical protein